MHWPETRIFFSPLPEASLRNKIATSREDVKKGGKNKDDRCLIKKMENQEALRLGNPADLGLSPGLPLPSCRAWQLNPPKSMLSNATLISHIWLFNF